MKIIVIDADYTYSRDNLPVVRLYGKNVESGDDVVVHVFGFEPYFYLDNCGMDCIMLKEVVEKELKGYINRIEMVKRYKPIGFQENKSDMLKIILYNPRVVPEVRKLLVEKIEEISDSMVYEADILFKERFMIDRGINAMSVIEFNENGKELKNYGLGCGKLYLVGVNDIKITNESVSIEY